jgi:predicted RNA binding protein YcfA (HicA-like mRNA interferase family)
MPEPPLLPPRLVIKILLGEGFKFRNARGTDQVYKKVTDTGSWTVTVATHGKQIPRGTMRSLCRQAGWTVDELNALVDKYK